jgi:hypothetical protein
MHPAQGVFVKQGVPSDKTGSTWPIFNDHVAPRERSLFHALD